MASLGAQTPQTPPTSSTSTQRTSDKARDINVTGCLAKGADGSYMLTNARVDDPASATTTTATTSPTTAGTTGTTATAGTTATGGMNAAMSWALMGSSSDLDKHVGHKIQVTGRSMGGPMDRGAAATPPATSTTTATTGTTAEKADQPQLDVQTVKMISSSCS